jgi:hypothetical protein
MLKNEVSEIKTLLRELIKHASNSSSQNWYLWAAEAED